MDKQRIKRIVGYLFSKKFWVSQLVAKQSLCKHLPDKAYLKLWYYANTGKKLNLKNPQTFSEKLQWLKLYNRNPLYTIMVDKYAVKQYVADLIGDEYIIPTIGVWKRPEDIDFDALPNQFVLKCNHDSGGLIICKDKSKLDKEAAIKKLEKSLKTDFFKMGREWPYKNVHRCIIAEKYIEPTSNTQDLPDYKWFCFNGEPKFCQVIQNRNSNETIDIFDTDWNHQDFNGIAPNINNIKNAKEMPGKPTNLETHLQISRLLSKDIPFSRIDLYEVGNRTYFGEITFYPYSGIGSFYPVEYNMLLGKMIMIPRDMCSVC